MWNTNSKGSQNEEMMAQMLLDKLFGDWVGAVLILLRHLNNAAYHFHHFYRGYNDCSPAKTNNTLC